MEPFADKVKTFISLAQTVSDHGPRGVPRLVETLERLVKDGQALTKELERERDELASETSRVREGREDMEHWALRLQNADIGGKLESVDQSVQGRLTEIQTSLQTMSVGIRDDAVLEKLGGITRNLKTESAMGFREVKDEIQKLTRSSDKMKQDIVTRQQMETLISNGTSSIIDEIRSDTRCLYKLDGVSGLQRQSMESFEGLSRGFSCLDNKIDGLPKSVASNLKGDIESIGQSCREIAGSFERWRTEFQSVNKGNVEQISSLGVDIGEYRKQVDQLSSDFSALRSQASTASETHLSEAYQKDNRAAGLIVEIEELKNARGLLEQRLTMKEEELAKVRSDVSKLRNEVDTANQTIARQLEIHNEDMRRARELQDSEAGQLQEIRTRAHALAEENADLRTQVAQATSQKALSDQILGGMENAIKSNTDFEGLETRARDLSDMYQKRSDEFNEAKEFVRLLKSKAADYDKLKLQFEDYQIKSAGSNVEHEDETDRLGVMLSNTERENSELKSKVDSLKGVLSDLQGRLEERAQDSADAQDSESRPLKRRCNKTTPPTNEEQCCLIKTLNIIADRAAFLDIVKDDSYNMDLVLILAKTLSQIELARRLLKFLQKGTAEVWFCFHEVFNKGHHAEKVIDPIHQRCTGHGNVCKLLVMVETAGSKRRLKFLHV
ncbi:hypothetical protein NW752_003070 [Fusarium irregulare]|uniref:Uncharacterized protein n=1 Tax=Fusarium irregulare TaxID=2494466 RepID=A0A9W8UE47_9HYPO|nr:hypothetical protein NW766_000738 [Fusarium irregulare]KAJ4025597.1 hypothetical protein NW752_003070 [Fusarium irregulare]